MSIVFVLSHVPDPRMNKRINLLKGKYDTSLVCWNRKTVDIWRLVHDDIEAKEISIKAAYTNPLNRIWPTCKFAIEVIRYLKQKQPRCIYTENVDMLLICGIYFIFTRIKPKIIYEIADLNKLIIDEPNGILKKLLRQTIIVTERFLCRYVNLLVLTSEKFYDIYFKDMISKEKVFYMPNMPKLYAFGSYKRKSSGDFTVGFIGAIRYKDQIKMLIKAAENSNVNVLFAGAGLDDEIEFLCAGKPNIEYHGKYDFDTKIASLYGKCDCIYAVYNADLNNVKVALPNKLYESIYCEIPIIVAKGTYLAELVEQMGVGVAVSHTNVSELEQLLKKLSSNKEYYDKLVNACKEHKPEINIELYNEKFEAVVDRMNL